MDLATECLAASTMQAGLPSADGTAIDTRGCSAVTFVVNAGTFTSTRTYDIIVQMATDAAFTTPVAITGAVFNATTTGQYKATHQERVEVGRVNLRDCLRYIRTQGSAGGRGEGPISVSVLLDMENTAKGGGSSCDPSTGGPQSANYAAAFNLQPNDDGS